MARLLFIQVAEQTSVSNVCDPKNVSYRDLKCRFVLRNYNFQRRVELVSPLLYNVKKNRACSDMFFLALLFVRLSSPSTNVPLCLN